MEGNAMRTRHVVLAIAAALAAPASAFAGGVAFENASEKMLFKKYGWKENVPIVRIRQNVPTPTPVQQFEISAPSVMSPRHGTIMSPDENAREHFTKTVLVKFWVYTPILNFGVPEFKRTNRFVESQSGPAPIHADNGMLRKI